MKSTRRVLLFAPYFLPRRRVGSMRPFRFVLHLKDFGWEPTVLTIAAPGQRMTPKEKRLLSDIDIIELRPPFDWTSSSESQLGGTEHPKSLPGPADAGSPAKRPTKGIGARLLETLDRQFPTDTWLLLFAVKYRELRRIIGRLQPDVLWCTGDPWSGLVVARGLAEHFAIPWVADFRDPWTLSEIRKERQWSISRRADAYLERKIIESANLILFQAESVEDAYRQHYHDIEFDTRTITNSFDPNVFDDPITFNATQAMCAAPTDGLHVGFFGRFRSMSPASLVIDALSAVRRRDPVLPGRIYIHSFGPLNEADAAYARERNVASSFVAEDAVPLEQALSALRKFDVLLVSTDISRAHIIPAKVFEYIAAGRPILSLSRNPEVRSILEQTGTGVQFDPFHPDAVADLLIRCLEACDQGRPLPIPFHPDASAIARYEARETTRGLALIFDEISEAPE